MKIQYDQKTDALYIELNQGKYQKSQKVSDSVMIDLNEKGKILGIEILDASETVQHFNPQNITIQTAITE